LLLLLPLLSLLPLLLSLFLFLKCHPERSEGPPRRSNFQRALKVTSARHSGSQQHFQSTRIPLISSFKSSHS
jgi:hypothetical protein